MTQHLAFGMLQVLMHTPNPLPDSSQPLQLEQPAHYHIQVQGRLPAHWAHWFGDMEISVSGKHGCPISSFTGQVADQAALHGLLARIRDLGLPLLLVQCVSKLPNPHTAEQPESIS